VKQLYSYALVAVYVSAERSCEIALSSGVLAAETQTAAEDEVAQLADIYPSGGGVHVRSVVREVPEAVLQQLHQGMPATERPHPLLDRLLRGVDATYTMGDHRAQGSDEPMAG
jgi:hypothetical protein